MRTEGHSGWRRLAPAMGGAMPDFESATKKELFECFHLAVEALALRPSARFILSQLTGFYREPVNGRLLVWPSNEFLSERTGLSDRAIRYALGELVRLGLVLPKDSANGKRFAVRSKQGQILDAYGFDLAPMVALKDELRQRFDAIKEMKRIRSRKFDEITIARRASQEALSALASLRQKSDYTDLTGEFERLVSLTPRRTSAQPVEPILALWSNLRLSIESRYNAACGGNNSRLIENTKDSPDQSCDKRQRDNEPEISLPELCAACPDAFSYTQPVRNINDLIGEAARLRGMVGINVSAWDEATEKIGLEKAAAAFFVVLEIYSADQRGEFKIKNPGGYYRSYIRMIADGKIELSEVVRFMRKRRSN